MYHYNQHQLVQLHMDAVAADLGHSRHRRS
jgi:hypothetical protein